MTLEKSVELLLEIGVDRIARHTQVIIDRMVAGLTPLGIRINSRLDAESRSSILSVTTGDRVADSQLTKALVGERIIVAERGPGIRISPHVHTTAEGVDRLVAAVSRLARKATSL
jgi:selenocysteine lyase/cysteine desulfurase